MDEIAVTLRKLSDGTDILNWIPVICGGILGEEILDLEFLFEYSAIARRELHKNKSRFHSESKDFSGLSLTVEERRAVSLCDSLRDKEFLGIHMVIKYLEKYVRDQRKSHILNAKRYYRAVEEARSKLLEHMQHFIMINLGGRRFMKAN